MSLELGSSLRNIVGVDDGYFPPNYKDLRLHTVLVAVLCEGAVPKDLRIGRVRVDYDDVNSKVIELVSDLGSTDLVILDGVTYAGFNVVDPDVVSNELGIPVITFFHYELNLRRIEYALNKHFPDGNRRLKVIKKVYLSSVDVPTPWRRVRIYVVGMPLNEAVRTLKKLQTVSPIPEPLRIADIVASGISRKSGLLELMNKH